MILVGRGRHTSVVGRTASVLDLLNKQQPRALQLFGNMAGDFGQGGRVGREVVDVVAAHRQGLAAAIRFEGRRFGRRRVRFGHLQGGLRQQRVVAVRLGDDAGDIPDRVSQLGVRRIFGFVQGGTNENGLGVGVWSISTSLVFLSPYLLLPKS